MTYQVNVCLQWQHGLQRFILLLSVRVDVSVISRAQGSSARLSQVEDRVKVSSSTPVMFMT